MCVFVCGAQLSLGSGSFKQARGEVDPAGWLGRGAAVLESFLDPVVRPPELPCFYTIYSTVTLHQEALHRASQLLLAWQHVKPLGDDQMQS
jgi:hypothetical protein